MSESLVKPKTETATYLREVGHSNKIQKACIKLSDKGTEMSMSDYINNAVNIQLKKDGVIK